MRHRLNVLWINDYNNVSYTNNWATGSRFIIGCAKMNLNSFIIACEYSPMINTQKCSEILPS